jgi:hypothetical protein
MKGFTKSLERQTRENEKKATVGDSRREERGRVYKRAKRGIKERMKKKLL